MFFPLKSNSKSISSSHTFAWGRSHQEQSATCRTDFQRGLLEPRIESGTFLLLNNPLASWAVAAPHIHLLEGSTISLICLQSTPELLTFLVTAGPCLGSNHLCDRGSCFVDLRLLMALQAFFPLVPVNVPQCSGECKLTTSMSLFSTTLV